MKEDVKNSIICAFVADAISLGPHWIYDTRIIKNNFGTIEGITNPLENSYHKGKTAGDFTHYGDQMEFLLEFISQYKKFDPEQFSIFWQDKMKNYNGYIDFASKKTLQHLSNNGQWQYSGSNSDEFGGLARMAPLLLAYDTEKELNEAIRLQTLLTHNSPLLLSIGNFLGKLILLVKENHSIADSVEQLKTVKTFKKIFQQYIEPVKKGVDKTTSTEIKRFGQMCSAKNAFPSTMHLLLKFETNPKEGILENVMAGGDSAARGIVFGTFMGLIHGIDWVPKEWLQTIKEMNRIEELIKEVPS
ncbi:MAG: ADP-ribosylglycohydrolase family protein [Bacteroidales bacterium]